ncbi:MAG TPA: hypothetical protein VI758_04605 [Bacteroidota bacterium]
MKQIILITFFGLIVLSPVLQAQSYAGDAATIEPTMIIDKPTAGILKRGTFAVRTNFFEQGGVLVGIGVGVFDNFSFGISYGGTNIIGQQKIEMNPLPGVNVKVRLIDEGVTMPALAIGFDSQGKEPYVDSTNRYTIKSPGFYLAGSKNYAFLGNLSIHGGMNLSLERNDGDKDLNFYVGAEKSIGKDISIFAEFDFANNDNNSRAIGKKKGYLNFAFRWSWGKGLIVGFDLKDVIKNQDNVVIGNRTLQLDFIGAF